MAAPKYADIWQYLYPAVGTGMQPGQGAPGYTPGYYTTESTGGGEGGGMGDVQVWHPATFDTSKMNVPDKYKGMMTGFDNSGENAKSGPSAQSQLRYNTKLMDEKLPGTKFGKFSQVGLMSLGSGKDADMSMLGDQHLANKNAMYFDPNYGWITPSKNVISNRHFTDTFADTIMPMIASMGMGAIGMPMIASSLVSGAKSFGSGVNPLESIMSMFSGGKGAGGAPQATAAASNQGQGGLMALLQLLSKIGAGKGG